MILQSAASFSARQQLFATRIRISATQFIRLPSSNSNYLRLTPSLTEKQQNS